MKYNSVSERRPRPRLTFLVECTPTHGIGSSYLLPECLIARVPEEEKHEHN